MRVYTNLDVPYGGGYSMDRSIIYIDRGIPEYFTSYCGKQYPLRACLIAHEIAEVQYLARVKTFNEAHYLAVKNDLKRLRMLGIPIDEYYGWLHHYVSLSLVKYRAGFAVLPSDLDMLPYIEDGILV